jgi:hypothetical protein
VAPALQPHFQGHLLSIRVRSLLFGVTLVVLVAAGHSVPRSSAFPSVRASDDGLTDSPHDGFFDFKGNEVRPAVARFKVDPTGALYEEHSPETEVSRLGSPKG